MSNPYEVNLTSLNDTDAKRLIAANHATALLTGTDDIPSVQVVENGERRLMPVNEVWKICFDTALEAITGDDE